MANSLKFMKKDPQIIFISPVRSHFVNKDIHSFQKNYRVNIHYFAARKSIPGMGKALLKQLFYILRHIRKSKFIWIWFADYSSFLPVLLGRIYNTPAYLVLGGYDVADIKELKYGSMYTTKLRRLCACYSIRKATLVLPVSNALLEQAKNQCGNNNFHVLPTGYNPEKYPFPDTKELKMIITVSKTENYQRFMIKGLDRFVELANRLPSHSFYIIGITRKGKELFKNPPANLHLLPPMDQDDLKHYYRKAAYYAQFSRSEGLPNALCEAMLCGCIPMVTDAGGNKDASGDIGLVLSQWDGEKAKNFISAKNHLLPSEQARQRIIKLYHESYREDFIKTL